MSQKLITLYSQLLDTAGLMVTADGCVSIKPKEGESADPFTVKGKRLVLPTQAHLKNPSSKTVMFHPLQENLMRGESEVFTEYRKALAVNINLAVLEMVKDLLLLAGSASLHSKLSPDQSEVLSLLKGVNKKTMEVWDKIVSNIPDNQFFRSVVKFYMKPSGKIGDKSYTRLGVVSFPLYELLAKPDEKVYGVELADKHREILKKTFEYIFPELNVPHSYSRGSNSQVAPMFDAMIRSFAAVSQPYNAVLDMFKDLKIPELFDGAVPFSSDWWDDMVNLDALLVEVRKIPMQPGNEGAVDTQPIEPSKTSHKLPSAAAAMAAAATPVAQEVIAPVVQQHHAAPAATPVLPGAYQQQQQQQQPVQQQGRVMTYAERVAMAAQNQNTGMQPANIQYVQGPNGLMPVQTVMVSNPDIYGAPLMVQQPVGYGMAAPMAPMAPMGYGMQQQPMAPYANTQVYGSPNTMFNPGF